MHTCFQEEVAITENNYRHASLTTGGELSLLCEHHRGTFTQLDGPAHGTPRLQACTTCCCAEYCRRLSHGGMCVWKHVQTQKRHSKHAVSMLNNSAPVQGTRRERGSPDRKLPWVSEGCGYEGPGGIAHGFKNTVHLGDTTFIKKFASTY